MSMYRCFRADVGTGIDYAYEALSSKIYREGDANGFLIDRRRKDFVEARFVEASFLEEVIRSPFGLETTYKRLDYKICDFTIDSDKKKLSVSYSGSIPKSFFAALSSSFNFDFYYEPIQVDAVEWMHRFALILEKSPEVGCASFAEYPLGNGVTATISAKGRNGVIEAANRLVNKGNLVASKVEFRLLGEKGSFALSKNGGASIRGAVSDAAKEALMKSLDYLAFGTQSK